VASCSPSGRTRLWSWQRYRGAPRMVDSYAGPARHARAWLRWRTLAAVSVVYSSRVASAPKANSHALRWIRRLQNAGG
jgi:hypothetical protein